MCFVLKRARISSLFLSIDLMFHSWFYVHSQVVSCHVPFFEHVFVLKSACISSLNFLSIDLMFHSSYYVHFQPVSYCLVPCFGYMNALKSASISFLFNPLT